MHFGTLLGCCAEVGLDVSQAPKEVQAMQEREPATTAAATALPSSTSPAGMPSGAAPTGTPTTGPRAPPAPWGVSGRDSAGGLVLPLGAIATPAQLGPGQLPEREGLVDAQPLPDWVQGAFKHEHSTPGCVQAQAFYAFVQLPSLSFHLCALKP